MLPKQDIYCVSMSALDAVEQDLQGGSELVMYDWFSNRLALLQLEGY